VTRRYGGSTGILGTELQVAVGEAPNRSPGLLREGNARGREY